MSPARIASTIFCAPRGTPSGIWMSLGSTTWRRSSSARVIPGDPEVSIFRLQVPVGSLIHRYFKKSHMGVKTGGVTGSSHHLNGKSVAVAVSYAAPPPDASVATTAFPSLDG